MTRFRSKLAVLTASVMTFGILASGCSLIQKTPEAIAKEKVAKVGSEYITRAELDEMLVPTKAQIAAQNGGDNYLTSADGKAAVAEQAKSLLDSMVEQKIMEQKAKELKLFKDDKEIEDGIAQKMDELVKSYNTQDELNQKLTEAKISQDLLKKLLRTQVISEKVFNEMVKDINVTDDEIKQYYEENKYALSDQQSTMEVSHILLNTEADALMVKEKLNKGEDFATLAKQYSIEPAAKESGGSLGEILFNDPRYDSTFVQAAMALKEGQLSDPVKTQFGYHIIKVTKRTEYPPIEFDKAKDMVKEQLVYDKQDKAYTDKMAQWKEEAKVKIYEDKLNS